MTSPSQRPDASSALHRAVLVLGVCVLTGLLLAGLAFPVVGGFGMLARAGADSFDKLPAELREDPLPQRSRILAADGSTIAEIYFTENRVVVPISEMPPDLLYAIVAIEDSRYYEHGGVDLRGLARAFWRNSQAGTVTQGGSTITQQYVKNVLIEAAHEDVAGQRAARERSTDRKIREAKYAIALERRYTKREILEKYLNISYFGASVYGVGTAAQYYFHKPAKALTLDESALLAGMVKNPQLYNPVTNPKAARTRRDIVLRRMVEVGYADRAAVDRALAKPIPKIVPQKLQGIEDNTVAPAFLDHLRAYFLGDARFGDTYEQRVYRLFRGGLVIQTTLDPKLQRTAQDVLNRTLPLRSDPAAAAVVVQPGTGEIRAMATVNHDPGTAKVNLADPPPHPDGSRGYQGGSTFKMFTLAAAVEEGLPLRTRIPSPASYRADRAVCDTPADGSFDNAGDSEAGNFDLPTATWLSVNTFYVQLQQKIGTQKVARMARQFGVPLGGVGDRECSLTLGGREVTPLQMAAAYAALAAQGTYCAPTPIRSVQAPGEPPLALQPQCRKAVDPDVANTVTSVLRGVVDGPNPLRTGKAAHLGRPVAGKTGTTNGPSAAWFDGYTPDLAGSVWMGYPTAPGRHPLRHVHGVSVVYGGTFPARMWQQIMTAAHQGLPVRDFVAPPASALLGEQVAVPDLTGMTPENAAAVLEPLGLTLVVDRRPVHAGPIAAGLVGAQAPAPGTPLYKGGSVVVFLSDGVAPPPSPTPTPSGSATPTAGPTTSPPSATASPTPFCHGKPGKCPSPSPSPSPTPTPAASGGDAR
ncbi:MAG TPA: transglycosylase domain-containing protein [Mycobacteriales bacterium]|nr:transglycosylase domain-containing protein [Mycobacteriales bacterium]